MEKGDISDQVFQLPRVIVVWEGFMANPPVTDAPSRGLRFGRSHRVRWDKVIPTYTPNLAVTHAMQQFAWRTQVSFDVVTFLPQAAAEHIDDWCDTHMAYFGPVEVTSPQQLASSLAYRPLVQTVCDPDPSHVFTYGGRGLHVSPTNPRFWPEGAHWTPSS